jgi:dihydrofolate synthase / folylpolyglutamate synthase
MPETGVAGTFEYLEALYRRPIVPPQVAGLDRVRYLLGRLGDPHRMFRAVHVTGTCGKGSTTTMVGSILQAAGYRAGLFRSPHMDTYRERIVSHSTLIDENGWLDVFARVRQVADEMEAGTAAGYNLGRASLFELLWAMAALHFAETRVDIGVVEVGVGGRLSPTNVVEPDVAVVTNVSLDHTAMLGPTEVDIAREKAEIIKPESWATTAATQPEVLDVIRARAQDTASKLWVVGEDVRFQIKAHDLGGETFDVETPMRSHRAETLRLLGPHQVANAATAISAVDLLALRGFDIPGRAVREALAAVEFPGRFEILSTDPLVVLDGARNVASAKALRVTLDDLFPDRSVILLIGVLGDKDAFGIVEELAPRATMAIVTAPPWEGRVGDLSRLQTALVKRIEDVRYIPDVAGATEAAVQSYRDGHLLLVTGSLYLVAEARKLLRTRAASSTLQEVLPQTTLP